MTGGPGPPFIAFVTYEPEEKTLKRLPVRRLAALAALAALTPLIPASAHVRVGAFGGRQTSFAFRAPVEGIPPGQTIADRHNQTMTLDFQPGLSVQNCYGPAEFTCTFTELQATWVRNADSTTFDTVDIFGVDLLAFPVATQTYTVTATQGYSDGDVVVWSDPDQNAPRPGPQIRVFTPSGEVQPQVTTGSFNPVAENTSLLIGGTATLTRNPTGTTAAVEVTGLEANATYPSFLVAGTCAALGDPYKQSATEPLPGPPNELWPSSDPADPVHGLTADANGATSGNGSATWFARPDARAITIHAPVDPANPTAPTAVIACAELLPAPAPAPVPAA